MCITKHELNLICNNGNLTAIRRALETANNKKEYLNAALLYASKAGRVPIVKYLIKHGADISHRDYAAFKGACREGHRKMVRFYVSKGVNAPELGVPEDTPGLT